MIGIEDYVNTRLDRSPLPTLMEKARIAKDLEISVNTLYRWCREKQVYLECVGDKDKEPEIMFIVKMVSVLNLPFAV